MYSHMCTFKLLHDLKSNFAWMKLTPNVSKPQVTRWGKFILSLFLVSLPRLPHARASAGLAMTEMRNAKQR